MAEIFQIVYSILDNITKIIYTLFGKYTGLSTSVILILSGILLLFWGYKLKKLTLVIIGLIFGISLGIIAADKLKINNTNLTLILIISLGIIFGILNLIFYFFTIIILGAVAGCTIGLLISSVINSSTFISVIIILIFAFLGGFLSITINKIMFIFLTSFFGYILFRTGFYSIHFLHISRLIEEFISIIVFSIGLIFQFIDNFYEESSYESQTEKNQ